MVDGFSRRWALAIMGLSINVLACNSDSKKKEDKKKDPAPAAAPKSPAPPTPPKDDDGPQSDDLEEQVGGPGAPNGQPPSGPQTPAPPGGGSTGPWAAGLGLDGCAAQGKVWVAIDPAQGQNGACGESLAAICCTLDQVQQLAGASWTQLKGIIDPYLTQGLKLYGCSTDGATKTTFHFARASAGSVNYAHAYIGAKSQAGAPPASCPKVTMQDLGFPTSSAGSGGSVSSGTATGTSTSTGTGTGP